MMSVKEISLPNLAPFLDAHARFAQRDLQARLHAFLRPYASVVYLTQQIIRLMLTAISTLCAICDPLWDADGICRGYPAQCAIEVLPSSLMPMSNVAYAQNTLIPKLSSLLSCRIPTVGPR